MTTFEFPQTGHRYVLHFRSMNIRILYIDSCECSFKKFIPGVIGNELHSFIRT